MKASILKLVWLPCINRINYWSVEMQEKIIVHRATVKMKPLKAEKEKAGTINATEKHVMPY